MSRAITLAELTATLDRLDGSPPVLVEALPVGYWRHTHLPGALNIPPGRTAELAPVLLPDKDAAIVVYCAGPT